MLGTIVRKIIHPVRVLAGRFVLPPEWAQGNYIGPHGCLHTAAAFVTWNQVEGDYLEFGVYRGDSFVAAYRAIWGNRLRHLAFGYDDADYLRWKESPPRFFAFDSFEGLPAGSGDRHVDYFPGAYRATEAEFRANLVKQGVDPRQVVVVPGFYQNTLTPKIKAEHGLRRVAVAMIDCDLYESTVPVLEFLTDIVGQGTILIFHDWFRFRGSPKHGEQRACREWLARYPHIELVEYWREGPQAVSFLVNLK
jgi:hypothetical protein